MPFAHISQCATWSSVGQTNVRKQHFCFQYFVAFINIPTFVPRFRVMTIQIKYCEGVHTYWSSQTNTWYKINNLLEGSGTLKRKNIHFGFSCLLCRLPPNKVFNWSHVWPSNLSQRPLGLLLETCLSAFVQIVFPVASNSLKSRKLTRPIFL